MYACGLRISEATTLEVSAFDRANRVLRIIGKGDKERLAPLPQPVLKELGHLCLGLTCLGGHPEAFARGVSLCPRPAHPMGRRFGAR